MVGFFDTVRVSAKKASKSISEFQVEQRERAKTRREEEIKTLKSETRLFKARAESARARRGLQRAAPQPSFGMGLAPTLGGGLFGEPERRTRPKRKKRKRKTRTQRAILVRF